ncbi:hypothetical protein NHX12_031543 [Muraenolepis orangiensis]|uniref:WD repeat domain phosphoinositide-interacting protein 1 n=1 Tax=Muraenolepis orangiensis TaxID=630683 RepID=A0A9Q0E470_9TELE|nr:hypothetical protein NHX12_031543 [Muraenolepis orangiensis]
MSLYSFGLEPLSCHAWNKDQTQLAVSPNNHVVAIYEKRGKEWIKIHELTEHSGRITGIDWAPESNRIVTCAADRNAYVWTLKEGVWKPTLVLVRINRAATCVKWSPLENKFALGSAARLISVCYFEKENDWWLSKHIKKAIRSTVLCLDWHPNNILLAAGSSDLDCRVFSAYIKDIEDKPGPTAWGAKMPFGELLLEQKDCGGWVHSVAFSPSGDQLALVTHSSGIMVVDAAQGKQPTQLTTDRLPMMSVLYASPTEIVAAGHDCCPYQFSYKGPGSLEFVKKLDIPKQTSKGNLSAMQLFQNLDKRATDDESNDLNTLHQNSITQLRVVSGERGKIQKFSSVSLDGAMVIWDFKLFLPPILGRSLFVEFPTGSVVGQNRENRCSRPQACDPGPRESGGVGMETAEGTADGPGGPSGLAPGLGCASFNQDSTSLAVGTSVGFKLYSLTSVEKLDGIHESDSPDVYIVERLFSSSLVVVVSTATPTRMNVFHFKKGTEICNYSYSHSILAVRLNRQRLVVCLEESIYIHNIKDMKLLKTLLNTPSNPSGLCALSVNHSNSFLAHPGSATVGEIVVYDANNLSTVTMIPAHDSPLAALAFNTLGTKLASASERGTVIRVFSVPDGQRLLEFRRGMKSPDGQFLCTSSNTETVHIFKLEQLGTTGEEVSPTWTAYVGKMFSAASSYLPTQVSGMMSQDRAFATAHLLASGRRNICTLAKLPRLLVVSADGHLLIYNVDPQDGGECRLAHKHRLFGCEEDGEAESDGSPLSVPVPACPSYAATAALPTTLPVTATLTGYSEDGGAKKGEVIPEHEFAAGPVCLDDENEFPPVSIHL